ncbi:coiled-coil domain-containing protein 43 isoform X3 [Electrophorus electricus]|uniref:coiled-coil domain-containing protein 43 isoform X3 n=1 Tax=Electrophorus electricus TaxID=8005 RepID=UPI0015D0C365|nr:coiled-coil domain-containing protein 43 isoform X3 [Electrophorus electricus]
MAAPELSAGEFENWLNDRLDDLEVDREVYGAYILGVLQEEENDDEKKDALQGILSAFLDEETLEEVCQQILKQWTDCSSRSAAASGQPDDEVQAITNLIEKQAQIVVKQKEVSEESKKRKEALLAQYANVTDEEDEAGPEEELCTVGIPSDKSRISDGKDKCSARSVEKGMLGKKTAPVVSQRCSKTPTFRMC